MQLITTPNPNAKKIEIEHGLDGWYSHQTTSDDVENNTLCSASFQVFRSISTIFAGPGFPNITKEEEIDWDSINHDIVTQFDKL